MSKSTHQKVLIELHVAIMVRKVGSTVQRSETLFVTLVDLGPQVQQVMHLQHAQAAETDDLCWNMATSSNLSTDQRGAGPGSCFARCRLEHTGQAVSQNSGAYHVQLLVGGSKVEWGASSVVLSHEIGVRAHNLGQLVWLPQPYCAVELYGLVKGAGRVAPRGGHVPRHAGGAKVNRPALDLSAPMRDH